MVPGDGRQPQANKHNQQRSFYSYHIFPQARRNEINTLRMRPVDAGITKLLRHMCTLRFDVIILFRNYPVVNASSIWSSREPDTKLMIYKNLDG